MIWLSQQSPGPIPAAWFYKSKPARLLAVAVERIGGKAQALRLETVEGQVDVAFDDDGQAPDVEFMQPATP